MSTEAPRRRQAQAAAARAPQVSQKRLRMKAWLLGGLSLAFYVGFYIWNLVRDGIG